ncbi:MAG TPA: DNA alkylation repair protein [Candidatus Omnitrophota bacterium]|nr:DNA alkylation repair protein [Candidatus Omnitrophota bacterium]HRZ14554.1 DNA alkylation repair protein [Candidatus Omnitrophota bacterium]
MNGYQRQIQRQLRAMASPAKARVLQRFFKTGPGAYGAGDVFIGVTVGRIRGVARSFQHCGLSAIAGLVRSPVHEDRLCALLWLVMKFKTASPALQSRIYSFYLRHTAGINNWDLVDVSAPHIVGVYLCQRDKTVLLRLARSRDLWERRIAMIATFAFIRQGNFGWTVRLATVLLSDPHDLIHKAVGWMLREVGKRDSAAEKAFLDRYAARMPRTMLRYAIERFPERQRRFYLQLPARNAGSGAGNRVY